jgi:CheY-like chemotaxis protein
VLPDQAPRVLMVDDMEDNLVALSAILRPLGLDLVRARSGEEAMKALLRDEFALILLDVLMPGMDGFETATHIKRLDQTKDVPIIFLTAADSAPAYAFRGYSVGAVDYLMKPFDPWVLRSKVEVFVDLYRKNQQLKGENYARLVNDITMAVDAMEETLRDEDPECALVVALTKQLATLRSALRTR